MAEDPSNGELNRTLNSVRQLIVDMRADIGKDLDDITKKIDTLVPREVFALETQQLRDRVQTVETQLKERVAAVELQAQKQREDRETLKRWAYGLILTPLLSIILTIVFQLKPPG